METSYIFKNAESLNSHTVHWIGDCLKWSPECSGCLMWTRDGGDWSSQDEGEYPTPALAETALGWYQNRGVRVDWSSLNSCDVVSTPKGAQ
jgi:hypothetical protein